MDYKLLFGLWAAMVTIVQYVPYIKDIFYGRTKPHAFTWFVWGTPAAIVYFAQVTSGGGPGAWAMAVTSVMCILVFILSLFKGERYISKLDWLSLAMALVAVGLWLKTSDPLWSVVIITLADALGFIPTVRKSWHKPYEETLNTYVVGSIKWGLSLVALEQYNLTATLAPVALMVMNAAFVVFLIGRRKLMFRKAAGLVFRQLTMAKD